MNIVNDGETLQFALQIFKTLCFPDVSTSAQEDYRTLHIGDHVHHCDKAAPATSSLLDLHSLGPSDFKCTNKAPSDLFLWTSP